MNKVDMLTEMEAKAIEKGVEKGKEERSMELAIEFLKNGYPIEEISKISEIPIDDLKKEYEKIKK